MLRVLQAQDKLVFAVSDVTLMYGVTPIIMILSNQKSVSRKLTATFICCKTGLNMGGKTRNTGFHFLHVLQ